MVVAPVIAVTSVLLHGELTDGVNIGIAPVTWVPLLQLCVCVCSVLCTPVVVVQHMYVVCLRW